MPPYTLHPSRDESQSGHPGALSNHDRAEKPPVIKRSDCFFRTDTPLRRKASHWSETRACFLATGPNSWRAEDGGNPNPKEHGDASRFVGNTNGLETPY